MPLISADNHLLLWTFLMLAASVAIYIELNCRWAAKIPGAVLALLIALAASNFGLIPTDAPAYDAVWSYIVPLAIPLLLFQLDLHALFKESGRLLIIFLISSVGTMLGALIGFFMLKDHIPELSKITGMISASYTGGGVNFAAMTARLEPSKDITAATIVADNLMMACYFFILIGISGSYAVRKIWGSPYQDELDKNGTSNQNMAADYWQTKPISLQSIALSLGASMAIVAVAFTVSKWLKGILGEGSNMATNMLFSLVTDKYLLLTSLTLLVIALFRNGVRKLDGSQELGTYGIYLFFVVIGIPASIPLIIQNAPLLFVFTLTVAMVNLLITLIFGKLLKFSIEEIVLACNANVGGPTTAAALAIGKGWRDLIGPILLIGTVGYIIGNYIGMFIYGLIQ
ncbi:DUF819 domain-containing protein [Kingella denitrificans]|jgi:expressed protein|uniref:DUF819 family protein n=1 Tax=Kingella denitrificans TaxID=502 RepID=UPI00288A26E9|nr:DUF819 family protein [Kingella denitrificans]